VSDHVVLAHRAALSSNHRSTSRFDTRGMSTNGSARIVSIVILSNVSLVRDA
jgi:hypothetical protein